MIFLSNLRKRCLSVKSSSPFTTLRYKDENLYKAKVDHENLIFILRLKQIRLQFVFRTLCLHLVVKVGTSPVFSSFKSFCVCLHKAASYCWIISNILCSCVCPPQTAPRPRGSSPWTARFLHPRTCGRPLRRDRRLRWVRLPPRPNPTKKSAPPWRPPCCSSSPSRTPARPPTEAKTLPQSWKPPHSRLRPGPPLTLRPNPPLKPQQDWGLRLRHSSPKTRTCVFPTEPPAERWFGLLGRTCVQ